MDAMFATSTQPNEVDPFAPAPADDPYSGWGASTSTAKKKKKKKGAVEDQPVPPPEPEAAPEPEPVLEPEPVREEDPWGFAAFAPVKKSKKKKRSAVEGDAPPPPPEPEAALEPEPVPKLEPEKMEEDDPCAFRKKGWYFEEPPKEEPPAAPMGEPIDEPMQEPIEEPVLLEKPQVGVESSPEEASLDSDTAARVPSRSPYTEPPVALRIGSSGTVHYVPRHLLPPSWTINAADNTHNLHEIDLETGHTLVHYLYTGTYKALNDSTPSLGLKHALLVYMVATKSGLDNLRLLAIREFKAHAENLNIFEIFDAIKADFKDLASLESDGWIHGFLHKKIQEAFEHDHRVFKNEALLETLDNAVLGKVVMRWVVEMYDENMSRMILEEKEARVIMEKRMEILESGAIECATSGQELVPPVVDECRAQEASEHGSVHTEGFHTISCPSEEIGGSEDCVLVDGDDLSGPVEQANDGWEDADLLTAEAVSAEPEAVPVEEEPVPRRKLSKKEKTRKMAEAKEQEDSRRKEEEVRSQLELHDEEQARVREEEEAKVREQQEAATAATAAAEIEPVTIAEEAVNDALPVRKASKKKRMLRMEEARLKEEAEAVAAAAAAAAAAELESVNAEREWKLRKKMKVAAKKKKREEATELLRQEAEAGAESLRQEAKRREEEAAEAERVLAEEEEARLREEEEEAAAAAAAASLKAEPVTDAEPRVCPSRAKHMINEKEWMECASCRAAMQHMAVRLSRTNVDEGTLQDLEKELVI